MSKPAHREFHVVAPAKVNLDLDVKHNTVEGRHPVDTVMQAISLADYLHITIADDSDNAGVSVDMQWADGISAVDVPLQDNLIYKAIVAFCRHIGCELKHRIDVVVTKNLPSQSGFGGGSSDCAAAIAFMAYLHGLDPKGPEAIAVACELGSDIAFFLDGGCALLDGYGDLLVKKLPSPQLDMVVARPGVGLSTAMVYHTFDQHNGQGGATRHPTIDKLVQAIETGAGVRQIASLLHNSLQPVACSVERQVQAVIDEFDGQQGVLGSLVSGSGSACFALCADASVAQQVAAHMRDCGWWAKDCHSVSFGAGLCT